MLERDVLNDLLSALRLSRRRRRAIERELQCHLEDSRRDLMFAGWKPEDARREAANRIGNPVEIAEAFSAVYRPRRHTQIGAAIALATGMLLGAYGVGGSLASATAAHHHAPAQHAAHHVRR